MSVSKEELIKILREELRRTLLEAFIELVPYIDEEEQEEIEEVLGRTSDYREVDFEDWNPSGG